MAHVELHACIAQLSCEEYMMQDTPCPDEAMALDTACVAM